MHIEGEKISLIWSVQLHVTAVNDHLSSETSFTLCCETGPIVYFAFVAFLCGTR